MKPLVRPLFAGMNACLLAMAGFTIDWPTAAGEQSEVRRASGTEGPWQMIGTTHSAATFTDTEPLEGPAFHPIVLLP